MIELLDVCKSFNGRPVLHNTNLKVQKNEVAGLLGKSGCGKSTILKLVAGLLRVDSGVVKTGSIKVAYIFQEHRLIPWKTALENVCFGLRAGGCNRREARVRAREYIQQVGLCGFENHYPSQLSGGMCQRVSIARAFATTPEILLMDEPFSAIDTELKNRLLVIVKEMLGQHQQITILYVTHNPDELKTIADRVYTMSTGGDIEEVTAGEISRLQKNS